MTDPSTAFLMFGATGDLARRMLLPSLYGLDSDGLLAADLNIVGTARSDLDADGFRTLARAALEQYLPEGFFDQQVANRFLARLDYVPLDINDEASFARLAKAVGSNEPRLAIFLSTAPSLFEPVIAGLASVGLASDNVRLALEKPLGSDLASSREINDAVAARFPEDRIFRVDHYLGKEPVQNLLALRFANLMFEPLWNSAHIDHVQITVAESVGLEGRVDYYDGAGALRDMVQNHMLQLLALVAMEPPTHFDPTAVRDEKVKVLRALHPITTATVANASVMGQYGAGVIEGAAVPGYDGELGRDSPTETFVTLRAEIDNWRWNGVPFYLRTGKRLKSRRSEILIQFKPIPFSIFAAGGAETLPNKLILSLQPDETIGLAMMAKTPGLDRNGIRLREIPLDLGRSDAFADHRRRIAYERLLLDLIEGNPTLFVRRDEVEAQWQWIDGIRSALAAAGILPEGYAAGSNGPAAAYEFAKRHGFAWHD